MASRSTNTMQEALQKMMRDIADMKTIGDADLPWLVQLENMVLARMKQNGDQVMQAGQQQQQSPMMPSPAGMGMGGGMMAGASAPNADELQRLLSSGAGGLQG